MQDENDWVSDTGKALRCEIWLNVVRFLASQTQERLPYRIPFVNSNDQIFIGNDDFVAESNRMIDYCFAQVLETISKLNEQKETHLK